MRITLRKIVVFAGFFTLLFIIFSFYRECGKPAEPFEEIAIQISPGQNRPVIFTNKAGAFFISNSHQQNRQAFYGITKDKRKLLQDYLIFLGDSLLDRKTAVVTVYPHKMIREYPEFNTSEEIFFSDSATLLNIKLTTDFRGSVRLIPVFLPWDYSVEKSDPVEKLFYVYDETCRIITNPEAEFERTPDSLKDIVFYDSEVEMSSGYIIPENSGEFTFTFFWGEEDNFTPPNIDKLSRQKIKRIRKILDNVPHCDDKKYESALAWALISLDNLIISGESGGIWAGLPWFDDYWGRDTFISLAGACLVRGNFEEARKIILSFAALQCKDEGSSDYGRIPNRANPEGIVYNTADGTPLFVRAVQDYIVYSGDMSFVQQIYPTVKRSVEGALKYHTDNNGFLSHGDAETWMDAVGSEGAWSPRGNRAVEVQALWYIQLRIAARMAELTGDMENASRWDFLASSLKSKFVQYFSTDSVKIDVDHLNSDNSQDLKRRPNGLAGLFFSGDDLVSEKVRYKTLQSVVKKCVYPYGVASLHQLDPDFHWYHIAPGYYPKDSAYHNGTIWQWLSGPVISELVRFNQQDKAWYLTKTLYEECLDSSAVGTIAELRDALPRYGKKVNLSGAISQAWSLAEFIRTFYQDYLGFRPDMTNMKITVRPRVPESLSVIRVNLRAGINYFSIEWERDGLEEFMRIKRETGQDPLHFYFNFGSGLMDIVTESGVDIPIGGKIKLKFERYSGNLFIDGKKVPTRSIRKVPRGIEPDLKFQEPAYDVHLKSTKLPVYPLLSPKTVHLENPGAKQLISADDPSDDDKGWNGKFSYPGKSYFKKGIFDIRHVNLAFDQAMIYLSIRMAALVQPGWHPEYGAQLTYLAVGIDTDSNPATGTGKIGRSARYRLPDSMGADRLIYIGGGFIVTDSGGEILCKYLPLKRRHAFQDLQKAEIRLAIPRKYIPGNPENWKVAILSGGQDDHGGEDLGDFRTVLPERTMWNGGGNQPGGSNVYDTFFYAKQDNK